MLTPWKSRTRPRQFRRYFDVSPAPVPVPPRSELSSSPLSSPTPSPSPEPTLDIHNASKPAPALLPKASNSHTQPKASTFTKPPPLANKKKRKQTPASVTPQREVSPLLPPHHGPVGSHRPKPTRNAANPQVTATRAQVAAIAKDITNQIPTTAPSTSAGIDPEPDLPRVGMGASFAPPPESDIRAEALWLIDATKQREEQQKMKRLREEASDVNNGGSESKRRRGNPPSTNGHNGKEVYPSPITSGLDHPHHHTNGTHTHPTLALNTGTPHEVSPPLTSGRTEKDSFEHQFAEIQKVYTDPHLRSSLGKSSFAPPRRTAIAAVQARPPKWHEGEEDKVVLTKPIMQAKDLPRDRVEQAYLAGYDGLTPDLLADCHGFVENVRENLRNICVFYFPQACPRREAFLEAVGRGLVGLGWQLTDQGDAAVQPIIAPSEPINWSRSNVPPSQQPQQPSAYPQPGPQASQNVPQHGTVNHHRSNGSTSQSIPMPRPVPNPSSTQPHTTSAPHHPTHKSNGSSSRNPLPHPTPQAGPSIPRLPHTTPSTSTPQTNGTHRRISDRVTTHATPPIQTPQSRSHKKRATPLPTLAESIKGRATLALHSPTVRVAAQHVHKSRTQDEGGEGE